MIHSMLGRKKPSIYYHAPDYPAPSWGIGLIYKHVELLRKNGYDAAVVHRRFPFQLDWLETDAPVVYLDAGFSPKRRDILVVPETEARHQSLRRLHCRKLVFVQGSFLILNRLAEAVTYPQLGYEQAIVIMPHTRVIVERHFDVPASIVPPFIAPYFFTNESALNTTRRLRRILTFPKPAAEDYDILNKMLRRYLASKPDWQLIEIKGLSHREAAAFMQQSAFLVNVNTREAFNTTVPEAMAAGCIPVCYEAYGGQDFLRDGENAFVFPNNYIYPLLDRVYELIETYDSSQDGLAQIRTNAYATARQYTIERTEAALLAFYESILA
jgi:hypothetical protein